MRIAFICTEKLPSPAIKGGAIQLMIDGIAPFLLKPIRSPFFHYRPIASDVRNT